MVPSDEFPLLAAHGLVTVDIRGDGNCLFNALSDQIYGHQNDHHKIRARVIEYMREHASYYKQFIDVHPGGGQRRNPKRKNAGMYSTPVSFTPPTQEEIDRVFESHLGSMARGGTYGDNMEISAFASAFGTDVKIYQHDFAYMVSAPDTGAPRQVAHIAYHTWEHYSSVRNINGPFTGLPNVSPKALSPEEEARNQAAAAKVSHVLPWMVNVVMSSLPYLADRDTIKKTLEDCKGNIDTAVSLLLDAEERASVSSQQGSTSSNERDPHSDYEEFTGPHKKQDRRLSRATKAMLKQKADREPKPDVPVASTIVKTETPPIVPLLSAAIELPVRPHKTILPPLAPRKPKKDDEDEWATPSDDDRDDDFRPDVEDIDDVASEYSYSSRSQSVAVEAPKPQIKIILNPTKTYQRQQGPQRKKGTARERIQLRKEAQKAARKESKRNAAQSQRQLEVTSVNVSKISPPLDLGLGIKTLYI